MFHFSNGKREGERDRENVRFDPLRFRERERGRERVDWSNVKGSKV